MRLNRDADAMVAPEFSSPCCRMPLNLSESSAVCSGCGASFSIEDGVVCFASPDRFYEGRWVKTDESAGSLRNYLVKKERFFVKMLEGRQGSVLDLGCAGGWRLYTKVGPVVGLDLSLGSLKQALSLYQRAACSDLTRLPFADESFDFVVSSDLIGHIPMQAKDQVLREMARVLKYGGSMLHYIETDGNDPLMRWARRYPDLWRKHIIEPDGHIGLQSPADTFRRFRRLRLTPVREVPTYRGLTYLGRFVEYFDNEYSRLNGTLGLAVRLAKIFSGMKLTQTLGNLVISALVEVGDDVLPYDWAGGVAVCYEKKWLSSKV